MEPFAITNRVWWVGALDPQLRTFDIVMKAPHGTTYNAYLVKGSEKTALIETVKSGFREDFFSRIGRIVPLEEVDYVILNHFEPDHSGALKELLARAPHIKCVASRTSQHFIDNILKREVDVMKMGDGDSLSLGDRTLMFLSAPLLHWPDTMFTYLQEEGILFPCDFLGAHYCDDRIFSDCMDDFSGTFEYYYKVIMRPFRDHVVKALDKLDHLSIRMICPSHGPIRRTEDHIREALAGYRRLSAQQDGGDKVLAIFYASAYGNTIRMAREIAAGAQRSGLRITLMDVTSLDLPSAVDLIEEADGVLVGSPTLNGDAVKPVWDLLSCLATLRIRKKIGGAFGSYGWSGEGPGLIADRLKGLKFQVPLEGPRAILVPSDEDLAACREYGARIAEIIIEGPAPQPPKLEEARTDKPPSEPLTTSHLPPPGEALPAKQEAMPMGAPDNGGPAEEAQTEGAPDEGGPVEEAERQPGPQAAEEAEAPEDAVGPEEQEPAAKD
jgi:flavorubredoxin